MNFKIYFNFPFLGHYKVEFQTTEFVYPDLKKLADIRLNSDHYRHCPTEQQEH